MTVSQSLASLRDNPFGAVADAFEGELNEAMRHYRFNDRWSVELFIDYNSVDHNFIAPYKWPSREHTVPVEEEESGKYNVDLLKDEKCRSLLAALEAKLTEEVTITHASMCPMFEQIGDGSELKSTGRIEFSFEVQSKDSPSFA